MIHIAFLIGCTSTQYSVPDIQTKAVGMAQTGIALTQTAFPTFTPLPPTVTPTATDVIMLSTPPPTQPPIPLLTPDAIQVTRWKEYQTALVKTLFSFSLPYQPERRYDPEKYKNALCEWDILGRSGQEVYVYAECRSADGLESGFGPAVVCLELDGSIREVIIPGVEYDETSQLPIYDLHLFPKDVQEKLCLYYFGWVPQCGSIIPNYVHPYYLPVDRPRLYTMLMHLEYRETHPEEPPLVILSTMPTATSVP